MDGTDKIITLPSTSTVADAAASLGITEQQFINTASIAGERPPLLKAVVRGNTLASSQSLFLTTP